MIKYLRNLWNKPFDDCNIIEKFISIITLPICVIDSLIHINKTLDRGMELLKQKNIMEGNQYVEKYKRRSKK